MQMSFLTCEINKHQSISDKNLFSVLIATSSCCLYWAYSVEKLALLRALWTGSIYLLIGRLIAMMGPRQEAQSALFYEFSIEGHVPQNHLLRKKVEMLFAHLKQILKLDRLRLRGP